MSSGTWRALTLTLAVVALEGGLRQRRDGRAEAVEAAADAEPGRRRARRWDSDPRGPRGRWAGPRSEFGRGRPAGARTAPGSRPSRATSG